MTILHRLNFGWVALSLSMAPWTTGCSKPELLETGPSTRDEPVPNVAVRAGTAVAAWHRGSPDKVHVSSYATASGWSAPLTIGDGQLPEVAISQSGTAFVAFSGEVGGSSGVVAAVRSAGVWGAAALLDTNSSGQTQVSVAADAAGNGLLAWSRSNDVRARYYTAGSWQPSVSLAVGADRVAVAMNASGTGVAGWCDSGTMHAARYVPATGWETPTPPAANCCSGTVGLNVPGVAVGIADSGAAFVVGNNGAHVCALRHTGTGWAAVHSLGSGGFGVQIAVNASGSALTAWRGGASGTLFARAFVPPTTWGPLLTGTSGINLDRIGVGLGSTGNGAVIFAKGINQNLFYSVYGGSSLTSPILMDSLSGVGYALSSGFDPTQPSQGITVWDQANGVTEEIRASRTGM